MRPKRFQQMAEVMEERDDLRDMVTAVLDGIAMELHSSYSEQSLEERLGELGVDADTVAQLVALRRRADT